MSNYSSSDFNFNQGDRNTSWAKTFELIPEGSAVLDVGCSSGTFGAELIKKKNCTVDGIEIDEGDFRQAARRLRKVYKFDVETDELTIDTTYDVIFMGDVVEHLARPITTLRKLRQLLKVDGVLVFSIPNITHMLVRLMLLEGKIEYGRTGLLDETHLHFYNQEEIYRVFNQAGFKITKFDYTVNDMPLPVVKKRLAALGLTPNKIFSKLLVSTNAAAYQFVGVAAKGKYESQTLPASSPPNIVSTYIEELKRDYQKAIDDLKVNLTKIDEDRSRILQENNRLKAELQHPMNRLLNRGHEHIKRLKSKRRNT